MRARLLAVTAAGVCAAATAAAGPGATSERGSASERERNNNSERGSASERERNNNSERGSASERERDDNTRDGPPESRADTPPATGQAQAGGDTPPGPGPATPAGRAAARRPGPLARSAAAAPISALRPTPWLGVGISTGHRGVLLIEVIDGTPAHGAGLTPGDEVVSVGGTAVATPADLIAAVSAHRVGDVVPVEVWRAGRARSVPITLERKLSDGEILERRLIDRPAPPFDLPVVSGGAPGNLADLLGEVIVIEFWDTSSLAAARTHGALSAFADRHARDGVTVLAIASEPAERLRAWARRTAHSFTVLADPAGVAASAYRTTNLVPAVVVIDRDGQVVYAGAGEGPSFDQALFAAERLLRRRAPY